MARQKVIKVNASGALKMLDYVEESIDKGTEEGIIEALKEIRDTAKSYAPVKTGFLRDHIGYLTVGRPIRGGYVEATAHYSAYQEWGTRSGVPGKFYMNRAFQDVLMHVDNIVAERIEGRVTRGGKFGSKGHGAY